MHTSAYTDQLLHTLNERLYHLQLQEATYGADVPVHVAMEIESTKARIERIQVGSRNIISVELLEKMETPERWKRLYDAAWQLEVDLYTVEKTLESDRHHNQSRHKEFNMAVQRNTFEIEMMKREQKRLYIYALFLALLICIEIYISFIHRRKYAPL